MQSIFFDVDGVLIHGFHTRPEKRQRWDLDLERDLGIAPNAFSDGFIQGTFISDVLPGKRSLVEALDQWIRTEGYSVSAIHLIEYWLEKDSRRNVELLQLVGRLKAAGGSRLYMATNQEHLRAMHLWLNLDFRDLFDDIFYAARLGALKPDAAFFQAIERIIGPQKTPPLFFDDSEAVVEGARSFGWDAVLYESIEDCADHPTIARILGIQPSS